MWACVTWTFTVTWLRYLREKGLGNHGNYHIIMHWHDHGYFVLLCVATNVILTKIYSCMVITLVWLVAHFPYSLLPYIKYLWIHCSPISNLRSRKKKNQRNIFGKKLIQIKTSDKHCHFMKATQQLLFRTYLYCIVSLSTCPNQFTSYSTNSYIPY